MRDSTSPPHFGERIPGAEYVDRPGGYAVILDANGAVAVVETPRGFHLPGGGRMPGESAAHAAVREAREECGLDIEILRPLGAADEYLYAEAEATHFRKRGEFFLARAAGPAAGGTEPDHELRWMSTGEALAALTHGSHRFALSRAR